MPIRKKIVLIGGAGYVGTQLALDLLWSGYNVVIVDNFTYGNPFSFKNVNLKLVKADVREVSTFISCLDNAYAVIHLACVSNDPSFDLDPEFGKSVNLDCFPELVKSIKKLNIDRFVYASSSSVYGIKDEEHVTENLSLEPLTDYSKFKVECEQILLMADIGETSKTIIRPATVCGPSLRQRLDVVVNIFAMNSYFNEKITVLGGDQLRPNIHIADMCGAYMHIIEQNKEIIQNGIYNVGFENKSVLELANIALEVVGEHVEIEIKPTNDPRSYRVNSDKIKLETGFMPKYSVRKGFVDLVEAFKLGHCKDAMTNPLYKNIDVLKQKGFGK